MKKSIAIQLSIPEPCTQGWNEMQPVQGGRHCASCQKVVTDFSRFTDTQLLDYFSKYEGGCGRFTAEQLDRTIKEVVVPQSAWWARAAAGILLALGLSKNADAQAPNNKAITEQQISDKASQQGGVGTEATNKSGIYGTLKDAKGNPVINAIVEVSIDGTVKGTTVTDFDGNYSVRPLDSGRYDVKFSYQNKVQIVNDVFLSQNEDTKVCGRIELSCTLLSGMIIIRSYGRPIPEPPGQHTFRAGDNMPKNW